MPILPLFYLPILKYTFIILLPRAMGNFNRSCRSRVDLIKCMHSLLMFVTDLLYYLVTPNAYTLLLMDVNYS